MAEYWLRISDCSSDVCSSDLPRVEHTLAACLTLAPLQGTKAVEAARDRRDEAPLAATVGRYRTEQRRGRLMRAMGAAETLDCLVSAPTGFEQIVVAARLVLGGETRVIAAGTDGRRGGEECVQTCNSRASP